MGWAHGVALGERRHLKRREKHHEVTQELEAVRAKLPVSVVPSSPTSPTITPATRPLLAAL